MRVRVMCVRVMRVLVRIIWGNPKTTSSYVFTDGQCSYKGKSYNPGEKWTDGCDYECICEDGASGRYKCYNRCMIRLSTLFLSKQNNTWLECWWMDINTDAQIFSKIRSAICLYIRSQSWVFDIKYLRLLLKMYWNALRLLETVVSIKKFYDAVNAGWKFQWINTSFNGWRSICHL